MPDPFRQFEIERSFDIDADRLRQSYLRLSGENHPDRFTDPLEQADAAERSAAINEAYRVLSDPESRAKALLGDLPPHPRELPPAVLMELMEVREQVESDLAVGDQAALNEHRQQAERDRESHYRRLAELFSAQTLDAAAVQTELNQLRYVKRLLEQLPA